jgi:hypothetical protein
MAKVTPQYNLAVINPTLARQWHPTRNGTLSPRSVSPSSAKKIWWLCPNGHEWESIVFSRQAGNGCPYCAGKKACNENCLETLAPYLAKQWHPTRNGKLTPSDVTPGSWKMVWWVCDKGHEWEAAIANRTKGRGCPYCSGNKVCEDNSLATFAPHIAKDWHPKKNGTVTPKDVTRFTSKKVWWQCHNGHAWKATVANRTANGNGCPFCFTDRRRGQRLHAPKKKNTIGIVEYGYIQG